MYRQLSPLALLLVIGITTALSAANVHLPAEREADRRAQEKVERFEAKLEEIQALAHDERRRRSLGLEDDIQRLLKQVDGTRFENKARYLLAEWRLRFAPEAEIQPLIEANIRSEFFHYKNLSRLLLARHHLAQGRVAEARQVAEGVVDSIPEFAPILADITFHEQAGQPAPSVSTRNLIGGPADPITDRPEPWLVYIFIELGHPEQRHWLEPLLAELDDESYDGRVRPVLVSFDSDPLNAMTLARELPGGADIDLLWLSPRDEAKRRQFSNEWQLPNLPCGAILGPDRMRMSHRINREHLGALIGKKVSKRTSSAGKSQGGNRRGGSKSGFGWKGR